MVALCALTLLAYANSFRAGFALDNKALLLDDSRLRAASAENVQQILDHTYWWPVGESGLYRPVTTLSYLFNYAVLDDRDQPAGYHWINFLLHCGNVLLVYALARRWWPELPLEMPRDFWPPVFTAALWAVHPVLTESVTNMVGRADLLAGMSVLGGLLLYLRSRESHGWRRGAWLAALMVSGALGMFSKESAAVLPAVIVLSEFTLVRPTKFSAMIAGCVATLLPLSLMLWRRSLVLAAAGPASFPFTDNPLVAAGFWTARLTAIKVMGLYLGLLAWPAHLSSDYSFAQVALARGTPGDCLAWTAVVAVAVVAAVLYRRSRSAFFLIAFAFLTLLPASNLLFPIGTIMAERLLYLPAVAFAGCLAAALYATARRCHRPALAPVLLSVLTAALAARTVSRNADWLNDLTLAASAVRASPNSFKAHQQLAQALFAADPAHSHLDRVIAESDRAVAILDAVPDSRNNAQAFRVAAGFHLLQGDLLSPGDPAAAQAAYRTALPLALRCASIAAKTGAAGSLEDVQELLAGAYRRLGDTGKAYQMAQAARDRNPLVPGVYRQLSDALLASGRPEDAAVALVEGGLVTNDPALRARLLELYRAGLDREGCALVAGPRGPAINPQCPMVRQHLCRAAPGALRTLSAAGHPALVASLRASLSEEGCSLDQ
jgi:hypothetical protein